MDHPSGRPPSELAEKFHKALQSGDRRIFGEILNIVWIEVRKYVHYCVIASEATQAHLVEYISETYCETIIEKMQDAGCEPMYEIAITACQILNKFSDESQVVNVAEAKAELVELRGLVRSGNLQQIPGITNRDLLLLYLATEQDWTTEDIVAFQGDPELTVSALDSRLQAVRELVLGHEKGNSTDGDSR